MTDIEIVKISLMEKHGESKESKGKAEYTIKASATLKFNEYMEKSFPGLNDEDREKILMSVSNIMFTDLLNSSMKTDYDSVGVWLTSGGVTLENAIALSVLEGIKEYGTGDTVPIFEFIKMTLPNEGEIS